MPPSPTPISTQNLTPKTLKKYLTLYPTVLQRVYKTTRPKLNQTEILNDDKWRYEELPGLVEPGIGLEKEQLVRLVKWKITHGQNRPFLPSMIAKNTPEEIKTATLKISTLPTDLSSHLSTSSSTTTSASTKTNIIRLIETALTTICTLKGVGPATGSLVLSVYLPRLVPFFGDEVFKWVVGETRKLKYDRKEYGVFLGMAVDVLLGEGMGDEIGASDLEKVGYVMGHLDVLGEEEMEGLEEAKQGIDVGGVGVGSGEERQVKSDDGVDDEGENEGGKKSSVPEKVNEKKRARKQDGDDTTHDTPGTRRSKRVKK